MNGEPVAQAVLGLAAQFAGFLVGRIRRIGAGADGKARQNWLACHGSKRATLGDLDGGIQGLGNVGKQHRHFRPRLETMIGRELLTLGFGNQPAAGNAEQGVVGFVVVGRCKIWLVGGDERQALGIGEINQAGLDAPFLFDAVAL